MSVKRYKLKTKKTSSGSWDIEKGPIIIVEPIKRTPIDPISVLEKEIVKSLMPISKKEASLYFMQGNPLEREQKQMLDEDLESYAREVNDPSKFIVARGIRKTRKYRKKNKNKSNKNKSNKNKSNKNKSNKNKSNKNKSNKNKRRYK
jgi:hypothetical protein